MSPKPALSEYPSSLPHTRAGPNTCLPLCAFISLHTCPKQHQLPETPLWSTQPSYIFMPSDSLHTPNAPTSGSPTHTHMHRLPSHAPGDALPCSRHFLGTPAPNTRSTHAPSPTPRTPMTHTTPCTPTSSPTPLFLTGPTFAQLPVTSLTHHTPTHSTTGIFLPHDHPGEPPSLQPSLHTWLEPISPPRVCLPIPTPEPGEGSVPSPAPLTQYPLSYAGTSEPRASTGAGSARSEGSALRSPGPQRAGAGKGAGSGLRPRRPGSGP